jgi:polar amino acid transport system substrate-binding protein
MLRYPDAGLGIIEPQLSVEPLGVAIAKGDPQFENLLRNYLYAFDKGGLIPRLRKQWFEDNSWIAKLP